MKRDMEFRWVVAFIENKNEGEECKKKIMVKFQVSSWPYR